jgi:hypothetical protein
MISDWNHTPFWRVSLVDGHILADESGRPNRSRGAVRPGFDVMPRPHKHEGMERRLARPLILVALRRERGALRRSIAAS